MKTPSLKTLFTQGTYLVFLASMAACSSSSSSPNTTASDTDDGLAGTTETSQDGAGSAGEGESTDQSGEVDSTGTGNAVGTTDQAGEGSSTGTGEDPLIPNSTQVNFNIQVPAYQSNALKVQLTWGDKDISAAFVGDEFWSVSDSFPTDSQELLTVTFFDNNGDITLASFEAEFRTGINSAEDFVITGSEFNSEIWDDDNDGQSNLDELIAGTQIEQTTRVLLFSEARGFAHDSIPNALAALEELAASVDIQTDRAADSAGVFVDENLANYDAVYWVLTSGDVLNEDEQAAFERYIQGGGGYAGIHAASDTEYDWPWYGQLVGAYFARHPAIQTATQNVEDGSHVSTSHLTETWTRTDEWYDFQSNPRGRVNVLLTLDEDSYSGGGMGADHPSAWFHDFDGGRSWYTGGGHTQESYAEPDFREHLLGGMTYAAGLDSESTE